MARSSIRVTLLLVLIAAAFCYIWLFYGLYLFIGLLALVLASRLFAPVARRQGWGFEGRLTRRLSRPPFEDERRKGSLR
jgi:hypothetical protein